MLGPPGPPGKKGKKVSSNPTSNLYLTCEVVGLVAAAFPYPPFCYGEKTKGPSLY